MYSDAMFAPQTAESTLQTRAEGQTTLRRTIVQMRSPQGLAAGQINPWWIATTHCCAAGPNGVLATNRRHGASQMTPELGEARAYQLGI
jgi:hypothetical protein